MLDRMIGQAEVKKSVRELLLRLQTIWDAEQSHRSPPQTVDTLVALAPTQAGADMSIILCGYKGEINDLLNNMNPGLKGRFPER
eukprot:gene17561-22397_t